MPLDDTRPNPDALLASLQRQESKVKRGRLKIFFGMAPGVGKTYAMLKDAHQRDKEGVDVVVGYVETHGRAETVALVEGLVMAPRLEVEYRNVKIEEMDLDAIALLRPQLVLVDELAHTNAPGSRHPKRYQDVIELLHLGLDVYTTLNVQHIESRSDTVRQITGITIHETVPDSVIELADEIELIDISPGRLRERLAEGKVYMGERATAASANFFKEANLTALRELALRLTAERVDHQLRDIRESSPTRDVWKTSERMLVAVGPSPYSAQLIRWTRRLAYAQNATWLAVSVEANEPLSLVAQQQLDKNLSLARELGAEVVLTHDDSVAAAILRVARQQSVTQIVAGKPHTPRLTEWWSGGSLVDQLIRQSGQINIHVVPAESTGTALSPSWNPWRFGKQTRPSEFAYAGGVVVAVTLANLLVAKLTGYWSIALIYLLFVVVLGLFLGRGPVLVAAALSALLWDYLFIPPTFTLWIYKIEDALMLGIFFVVALVTGQLTSRIRRQEQDERRREQRAQALYELTRSIVSSSTTAEVIANSIERIGKLLAAQAAILIAHSEFGLQTAPEAGSTLAITEKEHSVALWAFRHRRSAGRFTDTLPAAEAFHLPLATMNRSFGVLAVRPLQDGVLSMDQRDLLDSFAHQIALVLEKEKLRVKSESMRGLAQAEELHRTLFNSISHELRTPLTIIQAATDQLAPTLQDDTQKAALHETQVALVRLTHLVQNLLDSARLESGRLTPKREWGDVRELVDEALKLLGPQIELKDLVIQYGPSLAPVRLDFTLVAQALTNILHNAAVHNPPATKVELTVEQSETALIMRVVDHGRGIPAELLPHLFEKFHRASDARPGGTGLGLSIARGFIEAHGGTLEAFNLATGGAAFVIRLPMEKLAAAVE